MARLLRECVDARPTWASAWVERGAAALRVWVYAMDVDDYRPADPVVCEVSGCHVDADHRLVRCARHLAEKELAAQRPITDAMKDRAAEAAYSRGRSDRLDTQNFGTNRDGFECILPLTQAPSFNPDRPWIESALAAVRTLRGHELPGELQGLMAQSLAPGGVRADGLPAYEPSGPGAAEGLALMGSVKPRISGTADYDPESGRAVFREIIEYETRKIPLGNGRSANFRAVKGRKHERSRLQKRGQGRNRGAAMRDVLAAVAMDLIGCDASEVGTRILGGVEGTGGKPWDKSYRARERGRLILAQLGCWPWAHAEAGKLPRTWRSDEIFIEPLRDYVARRP